MLVWVKELNICSRSIWYQFKVAISSLVQNKKTFTQQGPKNAGLGVSVFAVSTGRRLFSGIAYFEQRCACTT